MRICPLVFLVCLMTVLNVGHGQEPVEYRNEEIGVSLKLPNENWKLQDESRGLVKVLIFKPESLFGERTVLLVFPKASLPDGLLTREKQIQGPYGDTYRRIDFKDVRFAGHNAKRLEYEVMQSRTAEWCIPEGDFWLIFQISSRKDAWENPDVAGELASIRDSVRFGRIAIKDARPDPDPSTPEEVRARRELMYSQGERKYELTHHNLIVTIDPENRSLQAKDTLTLKFLKPDVSLVELYTTIVSVDDVVGPGELEWEVKPTLGGTQALKIKFASPPAVEEELHLTVSTSSDDYFQSVDQKLVEEVSVVGQVREKSTFSSHILYYPIDETNDATANIDLVVPNGYTGVTGGELVGERTEGSNTIFSYQNKHRRKRLIPFGFAVAKYISQSGASNAGLRLTVFGFPGEEKLIQQRVDVAVESANLFEKMMGPLPWKDVRIAHVTPERKETGISTPGLIVLSDRFFSDISKVDLSDGNITGPNAFSLLVVADELSHQWNIYKAPLSNELGEGISTFTNILFVENRHGEDAFRRGIQVCEDAYLQAITADRDVAIADPAVYRTTAYRGIVFCKTPVILTMLRDMVGDEKFFAAWRMAFNRFDPGQDGFDVITSAFNETTGEDLSWFFDQWFFQSGFPELRVEHQQDGNRLTVTISQLQLAQPFRMKGVLRISGDDPEKTFDQTVEISGKQTKLEIECDFPASGVIFDPDKKLLKKIADEKEAGSAPSEGSQ